MTKTTKAALSDRSRFTVPTMGTVATITTPTPLPDSVKQMVAGELFRLEQLLSKFLPDSDISKLNRGGWAQVHPVTGRVLVATMDLAALSQGAFSPLIGRLAQLWDVKAYLAALAAGTPPPLPSEEAIAAARASCRPDLLEHGGGLRFRLREGSMLDLGGVAKGYAADRVRDLCEQEGIERALVDIGTSSIATLGGPWTVGIRAGVDSISQVVELSSHTSLSTSGDYLQRLPELVSGQVVHHIIDPATGRPAASGTRQVSVTCADGMRAEVCSTAALVGKMPPALFEGVTVVAHS